MKKKSSTDEFATFNLDKPLTVELKSSDQMRRHSIDKNLENKPIERALHILMVGEESQKFSVLQSLPSLIIEDAKGSLQKIIPKMNQGLLQGSTEYHITASTAVRAVIEQRLLPTEQIVHNFLYSVLKCIDSRDAEVSRAWFETLLDIVNILPIATINREIMPTAISKTDMSKPVGQRIMCCKLLGRIAKNCNAYYLKKDIFPLVQALAQDINKEVRSTICLELPVCASILVASIDKDILPLVTEFANDNDRSVKSAALQTLVDILAYLTPDLLKNLALPLTKRLIELSMMPSEDELKVIVTKVFGKMCVSFEKIVTQADKLWFLEKFARFAQLGTPQTRFKDRGIKESPQIPQRNTPQATSLYLECRLHCAYNVPAVLKFASSDTFLINTIVYPIVSDLTTDPYFLVRRSVGAGMHEVAKIMHHNHNNVINDFIKLLKDDSEEVLAVVVNNIKSTIECFCESKTLKPDFTDDTSVELTKGLLKCETEIASTYNWRVHSKFFEELEVLPKCFPSDLIFIHIVPILNKRLFSCRHLPCRLAIFKALLIILKYNLKPQQRAEIRNKLINDLCCSRKFYDRVVYAKSCENIFNIFSSSYVRDYFFLKTIALVDDKVASIRYIAYGLIPQLKIIAKAGEKTAPKLIQIVDTAIRNARAEKDRECIIRIQAVNQKLDRLLQTQFRIDPNDAKKIEEERLLANMAPGKDWKSINNFSNTSRASNGIGRITAAGSDRPRLATVPERPSESRFAYSSSAEVPVTKSASVPLTRIGVTRVDAPIQHPTTIGPPGSSRPGVDVFRSQMGTGMQLPRPAVGSPAPVNPTFDQRSRPFTSQSFSADNSESTIVQSSDYSGVGTITSEISRSNDESHRKDYVNDDDDNSVTKTLDDNDNTNNVDCDKQSITSDSSERAKPVERSLKIPVRKFTSTKDIQKSLLRRYSSSCLEVGDVCGNINSIKYSKPATDDNNNCDSYNGGTVRKKHQQSENRRPHSMTITSVTKPNSIVGNTSFSKVKISNENNQHVANCNLISRLPVRFRTADNKR